MAYVPLFLVTNTCHSGHIFNQPFKILRMNIFSYLSLLRF
uniref:Uncharacterized protein n=1 Tax=Arundo donax TaxID=35708 RepID=A0A0A8XR10_ARUDO